MKEKTLIILNKTFQHGFGVAPFVILRNPLIPDELKTLYLLLLSYSWYGAQCFPGQEKIAIDMGIHRTTLSTRLSKLKEIGLIDWKRRGLNKTNIYYILEIPSNLMPTNFEADVASTQQQDAVPALHPTIEIDEDLIRLSNSKTIGLETTGDIPSYKEVLSKRASKEKKSKFGKYPSYNNNYEKRPAYEKKEKTFAIGRGIK